MDPQHTPFIILGGVLVTLFGILAGLVLKLDRKQSEINAVAHERIGQRITELHESMRSEMHSLRNRVGRLAEDVAFLKGLLSTHIQEDPTG